MLDLDYECLNLTNLNWTLLDFFDLQIDKNHYIMSTFNDQIESKSAASYAA